MFKSGISAYLLSLEKFKFDIFHMGNPFFISDLKSIGSCHQRIYHHHDTMLFDKSSGFPHPLFVQSPIFSIFHDNLKYGKKILP